MGYDQKLSKSLQIFLNGKFLIQADGFELEYATDKAKQSLLGGETEGTVLNIVKSNKVRLQERNEALKDKAANEYDKWYQKMIKQVKNPKYHQQINWKDRND